MPASRERLVADGGFSGAGVVWVNDLLSRYARRGLLREGGAFGRSFRLGTFSVRLIPRPGLACVSRLRFGFRVLLVFEKFLGARPPPALPPNIKCFFQKFKGVVFLGWPGSVGGCGTSRRAAGRSTSCGCGRGNDTRFGGAARAGHFQNSGRFAFRSPRAGLVPGGGSPMRSRLDK